MSGDNVHIEWAAAKSANLQNWNDRVPLHEAGYGISAFDAPAHLSDVVREDLPVLNRFLKDGSLNGLDLCHLQCHIGTDTVSLARAGAVVTGVDFSGPALQAAAALAARSGVDATWVETDVLEGSRAVPGQFDVVYTSIGTICWLDDLDQWATQIGALLKAGGVFYIRDSHPALLALDEELPDLTTRHAYFGTGQAQQWDDDTTYGGEGTVAHPRTYEWPHPLSEIIGALIGAGLRIEFFDEGRTLPYQFAPRMIETSAGYVWPEHERNLIPCTFTIVASKN